MTTTDREVVLRERAAYARGVREHTLITQPHVIDARASAAYPLPTVLRPRVVTNNGYSWRFVAGWIERISRCYNQAQWERVVHIGDPGFEKELGAMLINPTEEVDDAN